MEAKYIAKSIKLDDRIESLAKMPAFITLKDHKENFRSNHPCRMPHNKIFKMRVGENQ